MILWQTSGWSWIGTAFRELTPRRAMNAPVGCIAATPLCLLATPATRRWTTVGRANRPCGECQCPSPVLHRIRFPADIVGAVLEPRIPLGERRAYGRVRIPFSDNHHGG